MKATTRRFFVLATLLLYDFAFAPCSAQSTPNTIQLPAPPTNFLDEFPASYRSIPPFNQASSFSDPENVVVADRQRGYQPVHPSADDLDYTKPLLSPLDSNPPPAVVDAVHQPPYCVSKIPPADQFVLDRALREDGAFAVPQGQPNHCLECFDDLFPKGTEWLQHGNKDIQSVTDLIDAVYVQCVSPEVGAAKRYWHRYRPISSGDCRIRYLNQTSIDNAKKGGYDVYTDHSSFPSGHSTTGMVYALVLADIAPVEYRARLIARGVAFGDDRVLLGVHYPSDVEAGRVLAENIYESFAALPAYQQVVAKAQVEFAEALKKHSS